MHTHPLPPLRDVALQPIQRLRDGSLFGYEALARFVHASDPAAVFDCAYANGDVAELDLLVLERSAGIAGELLRERERLFVNAHPGSFDTPSFADRALDVIRRHRFPLDRLVVEITEQKEFVAPDVAVANAAAFHAAGAAIALDDFGIGFAHFAWFDGLQPELVKVAREVGTGFERDPMLVAVIEELQRYVREKDCALIIEGIESDETARAARELGVALGQGFHLGVPVLASALRRRYSSTSTVCDCTL